MYEKLESDPFSMLLDPKKQPNTYYVYKFISKEYSYAVKSRDSFS